MESKPKFKSVSALYNITNIDDLNKYTSALQKVYNNPHKYMIIENEIRTDIFGEPYVIFQYKLNEAEEDYLKQKQTYFGEYLSIPSGLEDFDDIATKNMNDELRIIYYKDYETKDKLNPQKYRIVLYAVPTMYGVLDTSSVRQSAPKEGK